MNKMLYILLIFLLVNCKKDEKVLNIEMLNDHGDLSFSTNKKMVYERVYSFFDNDKVDSMKISLSDSDWQAINESFLKNKIGSFSDVNNDVGEKTNSIEIGEKYLITTNFRNLVIHYNYYFDDNEINKEKSRRFKKFSKLCDSIINVRIQKSERHAP